MRDLKEYGLDLLDCLNVRLMQLVVHSYDHSSRSQEKSKIINTLEDSLEEKAIAAVSTLKKHRRTCVEEELLDVRATLNHQPLPSSDASRKQRDLRAMKRKRMRESVNIDGDRSMWRDIGGTPLGWESDTEEAEEFRSEYTDYKGAPRQRLSSRQHTLTEYRNYPRQRSSSIYRCT